MESCLVCLFVCFFFLANCKRKRLPNNPGKRKKPRKTKGDLRSREQCSAKVLKERLKKVLVFSYMYKNVYILWLGFCVVVIDRKKHIVVGFRKRLSLFLGTYKGTDAREWLIHLILCPSWLLSTLKLSSPWACWLFMIVLLCRDNDEHRKAQLKSKLEKERLEVSTQSSLLDSIPLPCEIHHPTHYCYGTTLMLLCPLKLILATFP